MRPESTVELTHLARKTPLLGACLSLLNLRARLLRQKFSRGNAAVYSQLSLLQVSERAILWYYHLHIVDTVEPEIAPIFCSEETAAALKNADKRETESAENQASSSKISVSSATVGI